MRSVQVFDGGGERIQAERQLSMSRRAVRDRQPTVMWYRHEGTVHYVEKVYPSLEQPEQIVPGPSPLIVRWKDYLRIKRVIATWGEHAFRLNARPANSAELG